MNSSRISHKNRITWSFGLYESNLVDFLIVSTKTHKTPITCNFRLALQRHIQLIHRVKLQNARFHHHSEALNQLPQLNLDFLYHLRLTKQPNFTNTKLLNILLFILIRHIYRAPIRDQIHLNQFPLNFPFITKSYVHRDFLLVFFNRLIQNRLHMLEYLVVNILQILETQRNVFHYHQIITQNLLQNEARKVHLQRRAFKDALPD